MKKLILLLSAFALVFTSCSDDDDDSSQDPLVGTWKYYKYFENGVEQALYPCEDEETLVFNADGTVVTTDYVEINSMCEVDDTYSGTWTNNGNNSYTFTESGFSFTETLTFDGNTFYIEDVDDYGTPGDTSDDVVYRDVYIKQ